MEINVVPAFAEKYDFQIRHGSNIIGSVQLYIIQDSRHPDLIANVQNLWVDENHRGLGLGRKLMEALHQKAVEMGCREVVLTSNPSRKPARALYASMGYEQVTDGFKLKL